VERELAFVAWSPENRVSLYGIGGLIYTIKAKAMSGVTLLVSILPSHKTPNYPPMLLTSQKKLRIFFFTAAIQRTLLVLLLCAQNQKNRTETQLKN
jgi:hypothetical protein